MSSMGHGPDRLERRLEARHLSMLALGGTVGAGLFVGSGAVIATTGPLVVLSYAAGGLIVVVVMRMLAELTLAHPSPGSFVDHTRIAIGPGAAYAVGWLYWWGWVMALAFEAVVGGAILRDLLPLAPLVVWAGLLLVAVVAMNLLSVRTFGEAEYWLALLKVVAVVAFLGVGSLAVAGGLPGQAAGAPALQDQPLLPNGWLPLVAALVAVMFTYGGTEIVAIAAAEAHDPARTLVRATRQVVTRIIVFYVVSIAIIVALLPTARTPEDSSPFAAVLDELGVPAAAGLLQVVVLVALVSAMNSAVYVCSRTLYGLARGGDASPRLAELDDAGVPRRAVLTSAGVAVAALLIAVVDEDGAFLVLLGTAGAVSLPVYALLATSQVRLRRRREAQATPPPPVQVWLFPYLSYALIMVIAAIAVSMAVLPDFQAQLGLTAVLGLGLAAAHRRRTAAARRRAAPARAAQPKG